MSTVHASPLNSGGVTRCCAQAPEELADDDRITSVIDNVTCLGRTRTQGKPRTACAHWIAGMWINCCEKGETECPCICHDVPPTKGIR